MNLRDGFLRAVGPRLLHCTSRGNLPGIMAHGLLPPASLARLGGHDPETLALRRTRRVLDLPNGATAQLNHQLPILHGLSAANTIVDGHDAQSWAHQLDRRVFFWPGKRGHAFAASVARDIDSVCLWLDSARLFDLMADHLWLSPINSGNFRQGGANARRGDWLYCRASDGMAAFRTNRQRRGLVSAIDPVRELSITRPLSPTDLTDLLLETTPPNGPGPLHEG